MTLFLVHHADAVGSDVDPQRSLSARGRAQADSLAHRAKAAGCAPVAIWHSGKLRARQTAEAFHRICSPFAAFKMVRGLRPDDPPDFLRASIAGETADLLVVGHMPNIREILRMLTGDGEFPFHGLVAVETRDRGETWAEVWRA